jgi:hypothetical protein
LKTSSALLAVFLSLTYSAFILGDSTKERLAEVEKRGREVMPFSLDKTFHLFIKTENGGLQKVIVKDKDDIEQIKLIRGHLLKISEDFKIGNYSDPIKIHGEQMPGLADLRRAAPGQLDVQYKELPTGGQISYSANKIQLIHAIHRWFNAQLSEHAHHVMPSHHHHLMHSGR